MWSATNPFLNGFFEPLYDEYAGGFKTELQHPSPAL